MKLIFFLVGILSLYFQDAVSRSVHVNLTASWLSSKNYPLLETSEFLAEENGQYFWDFLGSFNSSSDLYSMEKASMDEIKQAALTHASNIGDVDFDKYLRLVLAIRSYSPTTELYHQLALDSTRRSQCPLNTEVWVIVYTLKGCTDQIICSLEELELFYKNGLQKKDKETCLVVGEYDSELEMDHVHPDSPKVEEAKMSLIVYGTIGTKSFYDFHTLLLQMKDEHRYIFRHNPTFCTEPTILQGYGIALDIKNMEYKTIDDSSADTMEGDSVSDDIDDDDEKDDDVDGFIFSTLIKRNPTIAQTLKDFRETLVNREKSDDIKAWDLKDLGFSAVQDIIKSKDPLKRLHQLSLDFPRYARYLSLASRKVTSKLREAADKNRKILSASSLVNTILINGVSMDISKSTFNAFELLKALRSEYHSFSQFNTLGLDTTTKEKILKLSPKISEALQSPPRINTLPTDKDQVFYLNNIETDPATARWPSGIEILEEDPWNLMMIRKNMFNLLIFVDPTSSLGIQALTMANFFLRRMVPIRVAVVITSQELLKMEDKDLTLLHENRKSINMTDTATAWDIARLLHHMKENHGDDAAREFVLGFASQDGEMDNDRLTRLYAEAAGGTFSYRKLRKQATEALKTNLGVKGALAMTRFVKQKGLHPGCFLFNGIFTDGANLQEDLMLRLLHDQKIYGGLVKENVLTDDNDWYAALLKKFDALPTYVSLMSESSKKKYANLVTDDAKELLHQLTYVSSSSSSSSSSSEKESIHTESMILLVDLDNPESREIVVNALTAVEKNKHTRMAIIPNPMKQPHSEEVTFSVGGVLSILLANLHLMSDDDMVVPNRLTFLLEFFQMANKDDQVGLAKVLLEKLSSKLKEVSYNEMLIKYFEVTLLARKVFKCSKGKSLLILNGQLIDLKLWSSQVFSGLLQFDYKAVTQHVVENMKDVQEKAFMTGKEKEEEKEEEKKKSFEDLVLQVSSSISELSKSLRLDIPSDLKLKNINFQYKGSDSSVFNVVAFIDPLSEAAQRAIPLLHMLHYHLDASLNVILIPESDYGEFPLKRFYRFLFDVNDPVVKFDRLPIKPILTMKLDTVESWNAQLLHSVADLDNLRVDPGNRAEIKGTKYAEFQLRNLIVSGQCDDVTTSNSPPPNGLQLILSSGHGMHYRFRDTLVMQNLGYFQLQATPGIWNLELAKGRARDIYEVVGEEGQMRVIMKDFNSPVLQLEVRKKKGKEMVQLLDPNAKWSDEEVASEEIIQKETITTSSSSSSSSSSLIEKKTEATKEEKKPSLWSTVTSYFNKDTTNKDDNNNNSKSTSLETIHVFSVASGHLYERFLKIMMLSVSKRTSNPVKFWLLENFLSPSFKESIPSLTSGFGIQIELITYKWPVWLRRQTEKQRIIWGYKILFLDVLFPLGLKKIIYVDADQVVRADLKDLWEMDLKGRVYAYTPFCASRKETLGFQFWRSGYWKNHLSGNAYHISALYVVDLVRFRRNTAGDILRAIYDNLSRDPNSLSNLDQDLPNYAQHQIPIFSLPQEWLWCESWCSDESKASAKTIDLCNNPLHKEPKLDMAKRVISGDLFPESWLELDQQVKNTELKYSELQREKQP